MTCCDQIFYVSCHTVPNFQKIATTCDTQVTIRNSHTYHAVMKLTSVIMRKKECYFSHSITKLITIPRSVSSLLLQRMRITLRFEIWGKVGAVLLVFEIHANLKERFESTKKRIILKDSLLWYLTGYEFWSKHQVGAKSHLVCN